jgi:hypothetical protein
MLVCLKVLNVRCVGIASLANRLRHGSSDSMPSNVMSVGVVKQSSMFTKARSQSLRYLEVDMRAQASRSSDE